MPRPTSFPLNEDVFSGGANLDVDDGLRKFLNDLYAWSDEEFHLNNLTATTDPAVTDDSVAGYSRESRWVNAVTAAEWVCLDASVGAAVWKETTAGAGANAIHTNVAGEIHALTLKGAPTGADEVVIEDSAGGWAKKRVPVSALGGGGAPADTIVIAVGAAAGTYDCTTSITAGSIIRVAAVRVDTAYDGAATLEVKLNGASPVVLLATSETAPGVEDTFISEPWHTVGAGEAGVVRVTVGGAPSVGAATVIIQFNSVLLP